MRKMRTILAYSSDSEFKIRLELMQYRLILTKMASFLSPGNFSAGSQSVQSF